MVVGVCIRHSAIYLKLCDFKYILTDCLGELAERSNDALSRFAPSYLLTIPKNFADCGKFGK